MEVIQSQLEYFNIFFAFSHLLQQQEYGCVVVVSYWMGNRDAPNSGVSVLALTLALPTKPMQEDC